MILGLDHAGKNQDRNDKDDWPEKEIEHDGDHEAVVIGKPSSEACGADGIGIGEEDHQGQDAPDEEIGDGEFVGGHVVLPFGNLRMPSDQERAGATGSC